MNGPVQLPNRETLLVEREKVMNYLLNLDHQDGRSKAKFFLNRGFRREHWEAMATALRNHGMTQRVTEQTETRFGKKFTVECQMQTPDGLNPCILTAWIVEGANPPRLVTAHPNC